jgi:hypothetical protein
MTDITNAQLMNAIKLLTRKVEKLEETIAGLQQTKAKPKVKKVDVDLKGYTKLNESTVKAILEHTSLKTAAESLKIKESELKKQLEASGIPHMVYEPWAKAIKRSIEGTPVVDDYEYPEVLDRNFELILKKLPHDGIKEVAAALGVPLKTLARYLWKAGYGSKGQNIGKPSFEIVENK